MNGHYYPDKAAVAQEQYCNEHELWSDKDSGEVRL